MRSEKLLRFCKAWHTILVVAHLLAGCVGVIALSIHDCKSVAMGLMMGVGTLVLGSLCFLILPAIFVAFSVFTRFAPVLGLPVFLICLVGNVFGDNNFQQFTVWESLIMGVFGSSWGLFNIWTAIIANKDEDFNPIYIANG